MGKRKKGKRKLKQTLPSPMFEQGQHAYRCGLGVGFNPYSEEAEPKKFNTWLDGWTNELINSNVGC